MTITLCPMTAEEFAAYAQASAREYAAENVRAGRWPLKGADERAAAEYAQLPPQGPQTPGHSVNTVLDGAGQSAGVLWYAAREGEWFIYDFSIAPQFQGRGYAVRRWPPFRHWLRRKAWTASGCTCLGTTPVPASCTAGRASRKSAC
ncbi:MAG: hypothetical protein Q4C67_02990 [Deinococcus sp.]|nr:hypothetical protein [Deinococcus sp.]